MMANTMINSLTDNSRRGQFTGLLLFYLAHGVDEGESHALAGRRESVELINDLQIQAPLLVAIDFKNNVIL